MRNIYEIIRRRPEFGLLTLAMFLSNLGSGLTQVALYSQLNEVKAGSEAFAVAFALAIIPGLFVGQIAAKLSGRFNWAKVLIGAQVLGGLGVVPALFGARTHSVPLFLTAEFAAALTAGLAYPIQQSLIKRLFSSDELGVVLKIDTLSFATTVLVGLGVGSLLIGVFGGTVYVAVDIGTYAAAAAVIGVALKLRPASFVPHAAPPSTTIAGSTATAPHAGLSPAQRRALSILPILALVGTPAMSLLPYAAMRFGADFAVGSATIAPSVAFIFAKSLGQMLGPMLVPQKLLAPLTRSSKGLSAALSVFAAAYCFALTTSSPTLGLALVMLAHIASNVVFMVGLFAMQSAFSACEMAARSAFQYRLQLAIMTGASLAAGFLAKYVPAPVVVVGALVAGAVAYAASGRGGREKTEEALDVAS